MLIRLATGPCVGQTRLERIAGRMARLLRTGDVVLLSGDPGTGKTSFVRAALRAMGWDEPVPSPTFTLLQTYDLVDRQVWHFDLYRLETPEAVMEIGLDEALTHGISLIEWPTHAMGLIPGETLRVGLEHRGRLRRRLTLDGGADWLGRIGDPGAFLA